jgi:hypothetical protein
MSLRKLLLPNVDIFNVCRERMDEIMEKIGKPSVFRRKITMSNAANDRANKYLMKQWNRLHKLAKAKNDIGYSNLVEILMTRSDSLLSLGVWRTIPLWYKILSVKRLKKMIYKLVRIRYKIHGRIRFKRVYIPKADGTNRSITVPNIEWRILSNLMNEMLKIWLNGTGNDMRPCQHGLMNREGPKQAWEKIIPRLNKKYIYEFDLRKFFDSVSWDKIQETFYEQRVPPVLYDWFQQVIGWYSKNLERGNYTELTEHYESLVPKITETPLGELSWDQIKDRRESLKKADKISEIYKMTELMEEIPALTRFEKRFGTMSFEVKKGLMKALTETIHGLPNRIRVPQGFGPSPLIACMTLHKVYKEMKEDLIMYLDDGIIMTDDKRKIERFKELIEEEGLMIAQNKSKILKWEGRWETDRIKFIGIEYIIKDDIMKGKTRNGSEVTCPRLDLLSTWNIWSDSDYRSVWLKEIDNKTNVEKLKITGLWGLAFALMYSSPKKAIERNKMRTDKNSLLFKSELPNNKLGKFNASSWLVLELLKIITEKSKLMKR